MLIQQWLYLQNKLLHQFLLLILVNIMVIFFIFSSFIIFKFKNKIFINILNFIFLETAREYYVLLRKLLSCEFALPCDDDRQTIIEEWNTQIEFLIKEKCFYFDDNNCQIYYGQNDRLRILLCNLIAPFVAGVYVTASVLSRV